MPPPTGVMRMIREYFEQLVHDEGSPYLADLAQHRYFGNGDPFVRGEGSDVIELPWNSFMVSRPEVRERALYCLQQIASGVARQTGSVPGLIVTRQFPRFTFRHLSSLRLGLGTGTVEFTGRYRNHHLTQEEVEELSGQINRRMSRSARTHRSPTILPQGLDFVTLYQIRMCWIDRGDFHRDASTELTSGSDIDDSAFLELEERLREMTGGRLNAQDFDIRIYFDMPSESVWAYEPVSASCSPVIGWPGLPQNSMTTGRFDTISRLFQDSATQLRQYLRTP